MPPMTAVAPSRTSTWVLADWVLIGGIPFTRFAKSAELFSTSTVRMTVPASVICGVTFRVRTASLKRDGDRVVGHGLDRDLDALLDLGGLVVLGRDLRRREQAPAALPLQRGQGEVEVEAAEDVAERDPDAAVEGGGGQVDRVAAARGADARVAGAWPPWSAGMPPVLGTPWPFRTIAFGKARLVVLLNCGVCRFRKPHWMPRSRVKLRLVTTMRASISTCDVARSRSVIRSLARSMFTGRSVMIIVLVRGSRVIVPRADSATFLTVASRSAALA